MCDVRSYRKDDEYDDDAIDGNKFFNLCLVFVCLSLLISFVSMFIERDIYNIHIEERNDDELYDLIEIPNIPPPHTISFTCNASTYVEVSNAYFTIYVYSNSTSHFNIYYDHTEQNQEFLFRCFGRENMAMNISIHYNDNIIFNISQHGADVCELGYKSKNSANWINLLHDDDIDNIKGTDDWNMLILEDTITGEYAFHEKISIFPYIIIIVIVGVFLLVIQHIYITSISHTSLSWYEKIRLSRVVKHHNRIKKIIEERVQKDIQKKKNEEGKEGKEKSDL